MNLRGAQRSTVKSGLILIAGLIMVVWVGLLLWEASVESSAHFTPDYERVDLSAEDYDLLFRQTGLGRPAVDHLLATGRQSDILACQSDFFAEVEVQCQRFNFFVSGEYLVSSGAGPQLASIRPGDILITPNSHFFGWRHGHAAIVVEASTASNSGLTLESVTLGVRSKLRPLEQWTSYPAFAVLRLREDTEPNVTTPNAAGPVTDIGSKAAALAREHFLDVPYRLTAGLWGKAWELAQEKEAEPVAGTQCAHLVWSCYRALGYDLDSDGRWPVTPKDLLDSPFLEEVQIYGLDPEKLRENAKIGD